MVAVTARSLGYQVKPGGPYMKGRVYQIVGVVGNVSQMGLDVTPMPEVYFPFSQRPASGMVVMIRTTGDPSRLIPDIQHRFAAIDRNVPIQSLRPFEKWVGATLERRRFSTLLLGVFAALAMILAAIGIYGVLNYWISIRQKEMRFDSRWGRGRQRFLAGRDRTSAGLAGWGIALGALAGWGASRWLKGMVFGISAENPEMILIPAAAVISIAALAASLLLWRATQIDPVSNLHSD